MLENPDLNNMIVISVVHGPCGGLSRSYPCVKDDHLLHRFIFLLFIVFLYIFMGV